MNIFKNFKIMFKNIKNIFTKKEEKTDIENSLNNNNVSTLIKDKDIKYMFKINDLFKSHLAEAQKINNQSSDPQVLENLNNLIDNILNPLKKIYPYLIISSGYRSVKLNEYVGGTKNSHHTQGKAADFFLKHFHLKEIAENKTLWNISFTQLITYYDKNDKEKKPFFIHISYDKDNLKGERMWCEREMVNGKKKSTYIKYKV